MHPASSDFDCVAVGELLCRRVIEETIRLQYQYTVVLMQVGYW